MQSQVPGSARFSARLRPTMCLLRAGMLVFRESSKPINMTTLLLCSVPSPLRAARPIYALSRCNRSLSPACRLPQTTDVHSFLHDQPQPNHGDVP
jgi:hypothetical protein